MSETRKIRIPLTEWRSKHWEEERKRRLENLANEERDTTTIPGKFAEALGCIEDAWNYLREINDQYPEKANSDDIRLIIGYGLRACGPAMDFWLQAKNAEDVLKDVLRKLRDVEPLVPKEKEGTK